MATNRIQACDGNFHKIFDFKLVLIQFFSKNAQIISYLVSGIFGRFDSKKIGICPADFGRLIKGEFQSNRWLVWVAFNLMTVHLDTVKYCRTAGRTMT